MSSPYQRIDLPVNLNMLCADYLSARNAQRGLNPRSHIAMQYRSEQTTLDCVLGLAMSFRFQDRIGGNIYSLSMELDAVELPANHVVNKEWFMEAADEAIDRYFERARKAVESMTESITELTRSVKDNMK